MTVFTWTREADPPRARLSSRRTTDTSSPHPCPASRPRAPPTPHASKGVRGRARRGQTSRRVAQESFSWEASPGAKEPGSPGWVQAGYSRLPRAGPPPPAPGSPGRQVLMSSELQNGDSFYDKARASAAVSSSASLQTLHLRGLHVNPPSSFWGETPESGGPSQKRVPGRSWRRNALRRS